MDGYNHRTITLSHRRHESLAWVENRTKHDAALLTNIFEALTITDSEFDTLCQRLAARNDALLTAAVTSGRGKHGFQNTVVRVEDQYGVGVPDYLLEFYEKDDDRGAVAQLFHTSAIRNVHKYSADESYRSVYVDCTHLRKTINKVGEFLSVSVTAFPELDERTPVGFTTLADDGIGGIRIRKTDIGKFFVPHRTALVTLRLARQQSELTFRFTRPNPEAQ